MDNETLEKLKRIYDKSDGLGRVLMEKEFSELRESEDEKIIKAILLFFQTQDDNTTYSFIPKKDIISWLEKQKDIIEEYEDKLDRCACESWDKGYKECKKECEWSEEDEKNLAKLASILEIGDNFNLSNWLKSLKPQPKQELNKEDDGILCQIITAFHRIANGSEHYFSQDTAKVFEEKLKSLCHQPKQECSEEDEKIRKGLIHQFTTLGPACDRWGGMERKNILAWLEKQGEQKHADEVKPKFKVGDWITNGEYTWKITDIKPLDYILQSPNGDVVDDSISYVDEHFHLWTIQDAKDGDVLAAHECYVIFKEIDGLNIKCYCTYHYMGFNPSFYVDTLQNKDAFYPATKEQCNLLLQKMKKEGYEWVAEKKPLRKIKQKSCGEEDKKETKNKCPNYSEGYGCSTSPLKQCDTCPDYKLYNQWKPSDEQMEHLERCFTGRILPCANVLESLYNDLKTLK